MSPTVQIPRMERRSAGHKSIRSGAQNRLIDLFKSLPTFPFVLPKLLPSLLRLRLQLLFGTLDVRQTEKRLAVSDLLQHCLAFCPVLPRLSRHGPFALLKLRGLDGLDRVHPGEA